MIIMGIRKFIIGGIIAPFEVLIELTGADKTQIANREFKKERLSLNGYIDVDELLRKGYEESKVKALLGQELINRALSDYFAKRREFADDKNRQSKLEYSHDIILFRELNETRLFWHSFYYTEKMEHPFGEYVKAFFDYIDYDFKKLCKLTKMKTKDMEWYIKSGRDVFEALVDEADSLWKDTRLLEMFSKKHELPSAALFEASDFQEGCPRLSESLQKEATKRQQSYMMIPKRNYLARLGVTREDAMETPFEYLFEKDFEYTDYHEDDDLYWSWEG